MSTLLARSLPFYYGWVVVGVTFVTMAIGVNARTAFSLLFPPILAEFGWQRSTTAAAFSIGFMVSMIYAPMIGYFMDRFGPRYVMSVGAVSVSGGLFLTAQISALWHLYLALGVLVVGGSVCITYIGHGAFLPNWFERKRAIAIGIAFSGVGIGSILMFPWLQGMIDQAGWRAACRALAWLVLVVLLPMNWFLQRRRPDDLGLVADGGPAVDAEARKNRDRHLVVDEAWAGTEWTLRLAIKTPRFWWVFLGFFSGLFAWYSIQVHQTKFLLDVGFLSLEAAFALGLVPLFGVAGQIANGVISDRIGREWGWTIGCLGFVLCYALLLLLEHRPSAPLMYLMVIAQGLIGYGLSISFSAIVADLFPGRHYGTIFGVLSVSAALGPAVGPWITGLLHDRTGTYTMAFSLSLMMCFVSILSVWLAAPRHVRRVAGQAARRQP